MTPRRQQLPPAEAGFALIEVLVSAIVILIVSMGTFGLLQAMTKASGEQRHRSQAYAIAQEDQARLRSMQLISLNHLDEKRTLALGGTTYTVRSTGLFINNTTSSVSCTGENTSADYARVTSAITWRGMEDGEKAVLKSIVSPSNNSIDSNNGTMTVSVTDEKGEPRAGVDLEVGVYSAETNAEGCATFPNLAQGSHSIESDGEDAEMVSTNSRYEENTLGGVGAGSAKVTSLIYDHEGSIPVEFKYRVGSSGEFKASSADSILVAHNVMKETKVLGTPGGPRVPEFVASPLFPFTSPYSVYAGPCSGNLPATGPALGSAVVPVGGAAAGILLQLPALNLTVWSGRNSSNKGSALTNAEVWIRDKKCSKGGQPITRTALTNASGNLPDPGLPWSEYDLCADTASGTSGSSRRQRISNVSVKNLTSGTTANFYLGSGTDTVSESGNCP